MSKVIKKIVKRVKKTFKAVTHFVKKHWKAIVVAAAIVFTAGAFAIAGTGAGWGSAFSNIGATFSAGASSLTGGFIGTAATEAVATGGSLAGVSASATLAADAAAVNAGTATAAQLAAVDAGVTSGTVLMDATGNATLMSSVGSNGLVAATGGAATGGAAASTGLTLGKAMMINTGLQTYGAYQQGKEEDRAAKKEQDRYDSMTYYGMQRNGITDPNAVNPTISAVTPNTPAAPVASLAQPAAPQVAPQVAPAPQAPIQQTPQAPVQQQARAQIPNAPGIATAQPVNNMDALVNHQYGGGR